MKVINPPQFHHSEILDLYSYDVNIPPDKLLAIIELPRVTLIADLEKILDDSIVRYDYFRENEFPEEQTTFLLHALFIWREINVTDSFPKILKFMEDNSEIFEFYLDDHITASLWMIFYEIGLNNSTSLKDFILNKNIDTYIRTGASEALVQISLHHPERRNEILSIYQELFSYYINVSKETGILESEIIGFIISDCVDGYFTELLPQIKKLFSKDYVAYFVSGGYEDVLEFIKDREIDHTRELQDIFKYYHEVQTTWSRNDDVGIFSDDDVGIFSDDDEEFDEFEELSEMEHDQSMRNLSKSNNFFSAPIQAVSNKINRNDPCPCGSGKKYKKCCIDRE